MMHTAISTDTAKRVSLDAFLGPQPAATFSITPVIHPQNGIRSEKSRTFWSAVANANYIVRRDGEDLFGPLPEFAQKLIGCPDLVAHGRRGPIGCEDEGLAGLDLWHRADAAALIDRPSAPVAFHLIGFLPTSKRETEWTEIILEFLDRHIVAAGMICDWALHALPDGAGGWIKRPHMHVVTTARFWRGPRIGQPQAAWFPTFRSQSAIAEAWARATE